MPPVTQPDTRYVTPEYRGQGDPRYPVPHAIHCPSGDGIALLWPLIVGYGYECQKCGTVIPIIVYAEISPPVNNPVHNQERPD